MWWKTCCVSVVVLISFGRVNSEWREWNQPLDWWQDTIIYQIYPSSFQDSDGDGIGDLKGIQNRLSHFVDTDIKTFWLSPIYKSPMADLGYDISNFTEVNKIFGTLDDFKNLMAAAKDKGLRILMDFVPNHTSDEHPWFQYSIERTDPYTDYYIWQNATYLDNGTRLEPNNWLSLFGGSGWTWVPKRGQYYYHQFNKKQPDLNFRCDQVKEEMKDIMRFWLDLGVDGFRMDAVKHIMEDKDLTDEVYIDPEGSKEDYQNMYHNYTTDWPDTYDLIFQWRNFLDSYSANASSKHTRVMLTEAYTRMDYLMEYYGNDTVPGAHSPFNFFLLGLSHSSNATDYDAYINAWLDNMPEGRWPNWVIGNHDNHRVATRLGTDMVDAFAMLSMLLPGTSVTYQGEEIGQTDTMVRPDQIKDPNNNGHGVVDIRDPQRGPFLWDSSENAGFTTRKKPWEPINPSYWRTNLQWQKISNHSHYKVYQSLAKLRHHPSVQRGALRTHVLSLWVFAFVRELTGNDTIVVVLNVGSEREVIVLSEEIPNLPESLTVHTASINSAYVTGETVHSTASAGGNSNLLVLRPKASVVLTGAPLPSSSSTVTPDTHSNSTKSNNTATVSTLAKPLLLLAVLPILMRG